MMVLLGTPSVRFTNSPTTGIYRQAADAIGISTTGVERIRVTSGGNVGIGLTADPAEKLEVGGNIRLRRDAARNISVSTEPDNAADGKLLTIASGNAFNNSGGGNIRYGGNLVLQAGTGHLINNTSGPDAAGGDIIIRSGSNHLTVTGGDDADGGDIIFEAGRATGNYAEVGRISQSGGLRLNQLGGSGTRLLRTDNSGNVSISTIDPANVGTVTSVALTMPTGFSVASSPITTNGTIAVTSTLTNGLPVYATATGLTTTAPSTGVQGYWNRSGTDVTLLNSGDNVGIGTTAATAIKMDVNGATRANFFEATGSGGYYSFNIFWNSGWFHRANGYGSVMRFEQGNGTSGNPARTQFFTSTSGTTGGAATVAERMALTHDGKLGLGTAGPDNTLTIEGSSPIVEIRSGGYLMMRRPDNGWDMRLRQTGTKLDVFSGGDLTNPIATFAHGGLMGVNETSPNAVMDVGMGDDNIAFYQPANNVMAIQGYIDGQWSNRTTYASGCCNSLILQPDIGNVGIRRTDPSYPLDVNGTARAGELIASAGIFRSQTRSNFFLALQGDRNMVLYDGSAVWASGTSVSDIRTKKDIRPLEDVLPILKDLSTIRYRYKDELDLGDEEHIGVIAQEVLKHFPDMVYHDKASDRYIVHYDKLTTVLLRGLQEQQRQIEQLNNSQQLAKG
jgi:hypothetical protein